MRWGLVSSYNSVRNLLNPWNIVLVVMIVNIVSAALLPTRCLGNRPFWLLQDLGNKDEIHKEVKEWTENARMTSFLRVTRTHSGGFKQKQNSSCLWSWASLVAQLVKNLPETQETQVRSLSWEDPLEKEMATHSSILAWETSWTEKPGRLQSMGSQRVGHDWATEHVIHLLEWKEIETSIVRASSWPDNPLLCKAIQLLKDLPNASEK